MPQIISAKKKHKRISIFDIDDTLLVTSAYSYIENENNHKICAITSNEFTNLEKWDKQYNMPRGFIQNHVNNFDEFGINIQSSFEKMSNGCNIKTIVKKLKKAYEKGDAIGILTARLISSNQMSAFLRLHFRINIPASHIICNNDTFYRRLTNLKKKMPRFPIDLNSIEGKKQAGILWFIIEKKYLNIKFYDDSLLNINSVKELKELLDKIYPNNMIKIYTRQITKHERKKCDTIVNRVRARNKQQSNIRLSTMKCRKGLHILLKVMK